MHNANLTWGSLLGFLCTAAMAVAQEPKAPTPAPFPMLESAVAEQPETATASSDDGASGATDVVSDGHDRPCLKHRECLGGACALRGRLRRWWVYQAKPQLQEDYWGYPEEFCEKPFGASLRAHMQIQIVHGMMSQLALYRYDFYQGILDDPFKLNQHGRKRLQKTTEMLQRNVYPLVIEQTPGNPALDAARREYVLNLLAESDFPVPEEWVVIGEPKSLGFSGEEALLTYQKLLRQTQFGGGASIQTETRGTRTSGSQGESDRGR
jgi:hypothetical protein